MLLQANSFLHFVIHVNGLKQLLELMLSNERLEYVLNYMF